MRGGEGPEWNPKGRELYYRNGDKMMVVDVATVGDEIRFGNPRLLFENTLSFFTNFGVSPDGQNFVMIDPGADEVEPHHQLERRADTSRAFKLNLTVNPAELFSVLVDMNLTFVPILVLAGSLGLAAQEREVDGNTITSSATPAVRLVLDDALEYVGGQTIMLSSTTRAEQHFYVEGMRIIPLDN